MKRLFIAIPRKPNSFFDRVYEGVIEAVSHNPGWYVEQLKFYSMRHARQQTGNDIYQLVSEEKFDAVVGYAHYLSDYATLDSFDKPIVMVAPDIYNDNYITIRPDFQETAKLVAQHLHTCQYKGVGMFNQNHTSSEARMLCQQSLVTACQDHGLDVTMLAHQKLKNELKGWLSASEHAKAFVSFHNRNAEYALQCARNLNLSSPNQFGTFSVSNSHFQLEHAPDISSIVYDAFHYGFRATEIAIQWADSGQRPEAIAPIKHQHLSIGESTKKLSYLYPEVESAVIFMDQHYAEGIDVQAVLDHVCVCRRTLERKFQAELNTSPKEYLLGLKLHRIKTLLSDSSLPVGIVAAHGGFNDAAYMSRLFKKKFQMTPREYRRSHRV